MTYRVEFSSAADRQFRKLVPSMQARLKSAIDGLADRPRPPGVKKLQGMTNLYRLAVGGYRVVYRIEDKRLLVLIIKLIIKVGDRKDVYRDM